MKYIYILLWFSYPSILLSQSFDTRTDSVDVSMYTLKMDMRKVVAKQLIGDCIIKFSIKQFQVDTLRLDLLGLTVDSIVNHKSQTALPFRYTSKNIYISLDNSFQSNTFNNQIRIYYHGTPGMDASTWGGFYFVPPYAWNLGVGFAADPHCYGRAWFPCMDNFIDRAEYDCEYTVAKGFAATCAACLPTYQLNADSSRTYFSQNTTAENYPTYLASIAVGPYEMLTWQHSSNNQQVPVVLAAEAKDTSNVKASFKNLDSCISGYIESYGPYRFNKVGYSLVPFNSGAMEHVGNIAYPRYAADGTLAYEHLYAHELSHQWWGDNTTCRTPEDMWLNEGWASYSEALFVEKVYGKEAYKKYVADNHLDVLHYAHIRDSIYWPVSGVPSKYTYGNTVYKKGSDMVHTLRGYMGDNAFFKACRHFQDSFSFSDVSSDDLKRTFQLHTTADLTSFFKNWIYSPGFPHYEVYLKGVTKSGNTWSAFCKLERKGMGGSPIHKDQLLHYTLIGENFEEFDVIQKNNFDHDSFFVFSVPFKPVYVLFDKEENWSDAISDDILFVKADSTYNLKHGLMTIYSPFFNDSAFLLVQHHWIAPGGNPPAGTLLSPNRYWTVGGVWPIGFEFSASLNYNGQRNMSGGYLDDKMPFKAEDSLLLFYRLNPSKPWELCTDYTKTMGSKADKKGIMDIIKLKQGDYALGIGNPKLAINKLEPIDEKGILELIPNPSNGQATGRLSAPLTEDAFVRVFDSSGKEILVKNLPKNTREMSLQIGTLGVYLVSIHTKTGRQVATGKLIIGQ